MTLWYVGRAAGTVSLVALTLAVVLGALGSTVSSRVGPGQPRRRFLQQYAHRAAAVVGLGTVAAHIGSLTVLDSQSGVGLRSVVIPMSSTYRPLAITLGALALWIFVFSAVVGASRGRLASSVRASRQWRLLHVAAYAGWMLSVGHSLLAGTDARTPWMVGLQSGCMAAVLMAVAGRLNSQMRYRSAPLVRSRDLLVASPSRAVPRPEEPPMAVLESHPGTVQAPIQTVGEPRLLAGLPEHNRVDYGTHLRLHGVVPRLNRQEYERQCEAVDLRGRGGAAFPVAAKLRSLPRRGAPVVVVNGSESEPASFKDRTLMRRVPHIVLDGALGVAAALHSRRVIVVVHDMVSAESLRWAVAERTDAARVQVRETQGWFVAGEARAIVRSLEGGPAVAPGRRTPSTVRGLHGRPTFVSNVDTYAQLGVLAHSGVRAYAATGLASEPGTLLVTLGGAVSLPCVAEIPQGTPLSVLLRLAGAGSYAGVLLGGYHGSWWGDGDVAVAPGVLRARGATLGAGVVLVLDERTCPLAELHRVASWLAAQSVRQCGPCMFGLPALADDVRRLAVGDVSGWASLERHAAVVPGRGACAHPDGAVRFVASGLRAFWSDAQTHIDNGHCGRPLLCELPLESPVVGQRPGYAWSPR